MNDININSDTDGYWDINFINSDLDNLTNTYAVLENGVILSLLTRKNELNPNSTYTGYGSRLYELIKENDTQLTQSRLKAYIKQSVEAMNRVYSVDTIKITSELITIYITMNDGTNESIGLTI